MNYLRPSIQTVSKLDNVALAQSALIVTQLNPGNGQSCLGITIDNLPDGQHAVKLAMEWSGLYCLKNEACGGFATYDAVVTVQGKSVEIDCKKLDGCNSCDPGELNDSSLDTEICVTVAEIDGTSLSGLPFCITNDTQATALISAIFTADLFNQEIACAGDPSCPPNGV